MYSARDTKQEEEQEEGEDLEGRVLPMTKVAG